ncbi:hypothetical protein EOPP23_12375 [Endozoicomonas sp. OPT23]|uniref:type III secretion HpaP family protein n=1 Tax=Endozoicomonas sp. OPT23 TaxID=2072845 RepID=UPI00129B8F4A|nr:type III secretion HpaP family protein [Endozoicomonas sp. OPT23]MRI33781.1 hypothetical protein [Endozoicomonas sp. OPT23]
MQPVNPGQQPAQNDNLSVGQNQKVSEDQAQDFARKMDKKKDGKGKTEGKSEQSLESLMAERRKSARELLDGKFKDKGEKGDSQGQEGLQQSLLNESAVGSAREAQQTAEAQLKGIQSVSGPKEINEAINKLVDKIMVSAKDAVNGAEVRMTLKDNILPGTEIRLQRVAGTLQVTMNTSSAESHNILAASEASLQKTLSERLGDKVQVNINMSGAGGEQSDGRSREEYVAAEDQDDTEES